MRLLTDNAPFLVSVLIVSIAALAAALLAERLLHRRASAAARHTLVVAALLLPLVLLLASTLGLNLPLPSAPPGGFVDVSAPHTAAPAEPAPDRIWPAALAAVWLAGVAIALLRVMAMTSRWREVALRAVPVMDDDVLRQFEAAALDCGGRAAALRRGAAAAIESGSWRYRTPELSLSPDCTEPTVIGIVNPVIVLPAGYDLTPAEMQTVFAHELAHVARRDNLIALIVHAVGALFWFDPLHRIARKRLVELRERACDDAVLDAGCDPRAYLAALARSCEASFHSPAVACMSRLNLQERMESIMTHDTRRRLPAWMVRTFITTAVAAAAIVFATLAPSPSLNAGQPLAAAASGYDFDVRVMPYEGKYTVTVRVDTPEGPFTSVAVVHTTPDVRTITSTHGGKTYKVTVNLAVDGSAVGNFEVTEGVQTLVTNTKTFATPKPRIPSSARKLEAGMTPPKPISRVEPQYPIDAKVAGVGGVCIAELTIDEKGDVSEVRVVKSLSASLDQATVDALKQWKFAPATMEGKAVPVVFNITMNYKPE